MFVLKKKAFYLVCLFALYHHGKYIFIIQLYMTDVRLYSIIHNPNKAIHFSLSAFTIVKNIFPLTFCCSIKCTDPGVGLRSALDLFSQ